ncbi:MAG TPA: group III truncated hemoglobin [Flavobacterium sp.]|uniref:group III truncated hemoglobin n=1 Tax=Flavobacterium sp. TaxID=239 RepID=UPI002C19E806|nr:group III truncated hemoglobin [Flavobacterium sp.]HSD14915.1 group III truncated hemoglobin [Flavobacterium sp.]
MKKDIRNKKDIEKLVDTFFEKVKTDVVIGYLFNDVAQVNWDNLLPKMYDFWENILFHNGNYDGNPMYIHQELHRKSALKQQHFNHWLVLFTTTIDDLFSGTKAEEIKERAANIANALMIKTLT